MIHVDPLRRARRARELLEAPVGEPLPVPEGAVISSDQEVQITVLVPVGHGWLAMRSTSIPWDGLDVPASS